MRWEISHRIEQEKLPQKFCLPRPIKAHHVAFVIQEKAKNFALSIAPLSEKFPIAKFFWEELSHASQWKNILELHPIEKADMAHYWHNTLEPKGLKADIFLESYGLRSHFQNLADWKELANLSTASRSLSRKYNFPLRVLRLWNRFSKEEQEKWLKIWQDYDFGRNLIQDIICDYYELNQDKRKQTIDTIIAHHYQGQNLNTGKKKDKRFKAQVVRNICSIIRDVRYPKSRQAIATMYQKKRQLMEYLEKNIHLSIPQNLETHILDMNLCFSDVEELKKQLASLDQTIVYEKIQEVLKEL